MAATNGRASERNVGQVYLCFLVRCRLEEAAGPNGEAQWRFTVQQAGSDPTRRNFACLTAVVTYLETELGACDSPVARQ